MLWSAEAVMAGANGAGQDGVLYLVLEPRDTC